MCQTFAQVTTALNITVSKLHFLESKDNWYHPSAKVRGLQVMTANAKHHQFWA
jgi:hypothetical protein